MCGAGSAGVGRPRKGEERAAAGDESRDARVQRAQSEGGEEERVARWGQWDLKYAKCLGEKGAGCGTTLYPMGAGLNRMG